MQSIKYNDLDNIEVATEWNFSDEKEMLMHTLHAYPAKFPAFIATKAFDYATKEGVNIRTVADVFCGCGTVALEAKLHNKPFWGCDINPVATLIARSKSAEYDVNTIAEFYQAVRTEFESSTDVMSAYSDSSDRLKYWFTKSSYLELFKLKSAIESVVPPGTYKDVFYCLFSSILKNNSKWLTKSIKPQIDPNKKDSNVWGAFSKQLKKLLRAVEQVNEIASGNPGVCVETKSFLEFENIPEVDLIITSPPYVTSYEYADLHQLSALWLDYADDYRDLRKGSIGSIYNSESFKIEIGSLNCVGQRIVRDLLKQGRANAKVKSVARYYVDIQNAIHNSAKMLKVGGMVFLVVGDTEYKGVKISNFEHLVQCLIDEGFTDIKAAKRRISNKLLTPYRDKQGRFSSDKTQRTVYHEEFIVSGRMWA